MACALLIMDVAEGRTLEETDPMTGSFLAYLAKYSPARASQFGRRLRRVWRPAWLGTLRRTTPLSDGWGYDRGAPVDRYYIEQFLDDCRADIQGHVLEVHDANYTRRFGSAVATNDVLDIDGANPNATIIADLAAADEVVADRFDCFILTQTLHLIYDVRAAIEHAHRILRPGGVLLVTVPAVSKVVEEYGAQSDFWRFTAACCSALFGDVFGEEQIEVRSYGNVLTAIAFLAGMAQEELKRTELDDHDQRFPVIVAVRAMKPIERGGGP
jgi:SAM-dependent methyltransferase